MSSFHKLGGSPAKLLLSLLLLVCTLSAQTRFETGIHWFNQRQWARAAAEFKLAEDEAPGKTDALLYLGKSLINLEKFAESDAALAKYLLLHQDSHEALYLLAYVRFRENKPEDCLQLSTRAAAIRAPTADDLKIVALSYVLLNDWTSAERYLKQALEMQPNNVEARYALGRVLYQQNKFDHAIAAFQEVLRTSPSDIKAHDNLGLALEGKNQNEAAVMSYRKAIELDARAEKHNPQPFQNLGILLVKLNRAEEALPLLKRASELDPGSPKIALELGKTYFALDRLSDAQVQLERAVRLAPDDEAAHYLLGRLYRKLRKTELANNEFATTERLIQRKRNSANMKSPEQP